MNYSFISLRPIAAATLALIACSGAAQAQVTVYGRANVDFEQISLSGTEAADAFEGNERVSSNSSRFGIRASKEFEGLKVFAQLETGVSWDAGGDTIASRDTFVGLEGSWGKLRVGKMDTPFKGLGGLTDRFKGTGIQDDGNIGALGGSGNGFSRRQKNALRLDSPDFGGATFALQYGLENEDAGASAQKKVLTLGANYAVGGLKLGAAYETHENFTEGETDWAWRAGANYGLPFVNVGIGLSHLNYSTAVGSVKRDYATVTAAVPVGNGAIAARYGRAGKVGGSAPAGTSVSGSDGVAIVVGGESGATQMTLGYEHNLFKGAQLYAYWTRIQNQANANYRFGVNALNVAAADAGADATGIVLGMLYDF